ncbi:hypothetical protein E3N88_26149 [Mikania micrantha]|uniref:Malectin-like domain-containing protein n=1 Tax=Mikania micrantha TaxID=192012 RepID=A0A5N6N8E4_9ASTR|nr:hypothetical protein E3N88_26149 [Mikania micrantha]
MSCLKWVALVLAFVLSSFVHPSSTTSFSPVDSYLIVCGSSQNVTFLGQTYVPDSDESSKVSLNNKQDSYVVHSNSSVPLPVHESARVFTKTTTYQFKIKKPSLHWIRLYFYPIPGHNLTSASLTVVTENFVLLNNYTFKSYNGSDHLFKEYLINVTSNSLLLNFIPSNNSIAFINAIEVVSVPDELIPNEATTVFPSTTVNGLSFHTFETMYRLNMGGPKLTPQNDTLGRTWENDKDYIHVNGSAANVSVNPSVIKYTESVTPEIAPNWVYATAQTMGDANVADIDFNITWVLPVDPNFTYLVRVHFCDIVSTSLNTLVFNLYINSENAYPDLELSSLTGSLDVPFYKDFVCNSSDDSGTLTVSIGPDTVAEDKNVILNGLEVLKISNEARSLDGITSVENILVFPSKKTKKTGVIIGGVVAIVVLSLCLCLCLCCIMAKRSKTSQLKPSWLPLPLHGNSLTVTKMSTASQKSGTASCISLASCNLGRNFTFQEIMDATNKFDEIICSRPALNPVLPRDQVNIAEWALTWQKKGMLDHIMDGNLAGKVNPASLKKFGETAEKCLAEYGVDRPSMGDVLWNLEYSLQLEETSSALMEPDDNSTNHIQEIPFTPVEPFENTTSMIDGAHSCTDEDATSAVFSQLVNPRGR